jgi:hypothetical protein
MPELLKTMFRPLFLDLLDVLLPLAAVFLALLGGRFLERATLWIFRTIIGLAITIVVVLGVTFFTPYRGEVGDALWHVGGVSTIACGAAMLLLGVVWAARGRSTSTGFLRVMAGLVGLIVVLSSGGRLWWRTVSTAAWQNAPDAKGCLTQSSGWTCAPAAAAMLLHQHGIAASEGEMAYLAGTSYLGTDVPSIARSLALKSELRLSAQIKNADYDACREMTNPFYASVHVPGIGGHAVLVLRVFADEVELIDPRFGRREKIARAEIEPHWQGKIVYLVRGP